MSATTRAAAWLGAALIGLAGLALPLTPAHADPGHPGAPSSPVALFSENFQHRPAGSNTALSAYVGEGGQTYGADPTWLSTAHCNGFIVDWTTPWTSGDCSGTDGLTSGLYEFESLKRLVYALGVVSGASNPAHNAAVAANTSAGDPGADKIEFETATPISLPAVNRFVTFGVDAVAGSCAVAAHPELRFYLRDADGHQLPVSQSPIDPCDGDEVALPAAVGSGIRGGSFSSDGSYLLQGDSFDIVMRNEQGSGNGNDGAFDNIRILDATPQLDLAFSPGSVAAGATTTLTFTITNTSELAAKDGWGFHDTLPSGLVVGSGGLGGSCHATTSATPGTATVAVSGGRIDAGDASCTVTVPVTSPHPAGAEASPVTYQNCAADFSGVVGLDLPSCAEVEFHGVPLPPVAWTSSSTGGKALAAGAIVTYVIRVHNPGTVPDTVDYYDDLTHLLDDATLVGKPTSPALHAGVERRFLRITGTLPAAATTEITFKAKVKADRSAGDDLLATFLSPAGGGGRPAPTPPEPICAATGPRPSCTLDRASQLTVTKTADVSDTPAREGSVVTYTLTFANSGRGPAVVAATDDLRDVLDDATLSQRPIASSSDLRIRTTRDPWSIAGVLPGGATTTIVYQATIKPAGQRGNDSVRNVLIDGGAMVGQTCATHQDVSCVVTTPVQLGTAGDTPSGGAGPGTPACEHTAGCAELSAAPAPLQQAGVLAETGAPALLPASVTALLALIAGLALLLGGIRRRGPAAVATDPRD